MAEDRADMWELKLERIDTHLCQATGERTGHQSQRKQSLRAGTQPEASVLCSQQGTLTANKPHFLLCLICPFHTPLLAPARCLSPSPANDTQGRNEDRGTSAPFVIVTLKFSLLPAKYPTIQK